MTPQEEEYRLKQIQSIEGIQVGTKDINGHDVLRVLVKSDEFVIYEIVAPNPRFLKNLYPYIGRRRFKRYNGSLQ